MQISFDCHPKLRRSVTLTLNSNTIEEAINNNLFDLAKTVCIDGFRKGKAPINLVIQRYRNYICQDVLNQLMRQEFRKVMLKEKINIFSKPNYIYSTYQSNKDLIYKVEFEVSPTVELKGIHTIIVERPLVNIKETDIDQMLEQLIKQNAYWEKTNNIAKITDRVTIDLYGTIGNKKLKGSQIKNLKFTIGVDHKHILPDLANGIIGHKAGENFNIKLHFPDNYYLNNLRGQFAIFTITLKKVEQYSIPNLDEAFIKLLGVVDGTMEGLRDKIRQDIEYLLNNSIRHYIKAQVIDYLLSLNHIDVPDILIEQEMKTLQQHISSKRNQNNQTPELAYDLVKAQAKRRIQITLLLSEIIKNNNIKINTARLQALMKEIIRTYNSHPSMRRHISNIVLEEQAIEFLLSKAKIIEKEIDFPDFMSKLSNS